MDSVADRGDVDLAMMSLQSQSRPVTNQPGEEWLILTALNMLPLQ
jgi:hypothetical protein